MIRNSHQGLKARSIMPRNRTFTPYHTAQMIGRAVGAEYQMTRRSWGGAPGWDKVGAVPLKSGVRALRLKRHAGKLRLKNRVWALAL